MPFVRKTDSQGSQPPTDDRKLFIGRTGELLFFVQNILKPEESTHNIISIWGQGGVGKSTLLARHLEIRLVILSEAKDLGVRRTRSFASLRMTSQDISQERSQKVLSPNFYLLTRFIDETRSSEFKD